MGLTLHGQNCTSLLDPRQAVFSRSSPCIVGGPLPPDRPYTFEVERTRNWQALEPDARAAAQARAGALTTHEHLPCPQELAQRARWK